jgi:16S rRNA processing protein RimM
MYVIGTVLRPQGVKGELKVESVSPRLERFKDLKEIYLKKDIMQTYSVETVRLADRFVYLKLKEVNTRTEAELLRGAEILVGKEDLIQLAADEYFIHDLIGCQVYTEQGETIGEITDVMQLSSNDVYVIKTASGREVLIPAIKDVVKKVMPEARRIVVRLLEGLLD